MGTQPLGLVELCGRLAGIALANGDRGLQGQADVRRRLIEEFGHSSLLVELPPRKLRTDQLSERGHGKHRLGILLADGIQVFVGPIQVAAEAEQLRQQGEG